MTAGMKVASASIAVLLVLSGCGLRAPSSTTVVKTDVTPVYGIDWLDPDTWSSTIPSTSTAAFRLGTVPVAGGDLAPLPVQTDRSCVQERFANPLVMHDGRLALNYLFRREGDGRSRLVSILALQPPSTTPKELGNVGHDP